VISLAFIGPCWQRDPADNDRLSQRATAPATLA
jgi:hypothetical protein